MKQTCNLHNLPFVFHTLHHMTVEVTLMHRFSDPTDNASISSEEIACPSHHNFVYHITVADSAGRSSDCNAAQIQVRVRVRERERDVNKRTDC